MISSTRKGYTLLELIIVITLLTGLSAMMLLNSSNSRNFSRLESSARKLESALTQAQAYGNSGKAFPVGGSSPKDFDKGYGVFVTTNVGANNAIIIYGGGYDANNNNTYEVDEEKYSTSAQVFETIKLDAGVTVHQIRGANNSSGNAQEGHVLFRRGITGAHVYTNSPIVAGLDITLRSGGVDKVVTVNNTGLIYIQ